MAKTRAPLTRDRILEAALELADAHGVESLKMRELAGALGFEAMALYRHVANKEAILDGILDIVLAEIEPAVGADWRDAIRRSAVSAHDAFGRHPWSTRLIMSAAHIRPRRLAYMESLLEQLAAAGLSDAAIYHAYHVLDAYIVGFALWEAGHTLTAEEQRVVVEKLSREVSLDDDFPHLALHRDQHVTDGPHREASAFEIGLDMILDGFATGQPARRRND